MPLKILALSGLKKSFRLPEGGTRKVIDLPSLSLAEGEQLALEAPSGTGKTTLLHLVAGILRPDSGSILLEGQELSGLDEAALDRIRAEKIGYVFQAFNLLQGYSALENVMMAMSLAGRADGAKAEGLLRRVGLGARLHDKPGRLSTGQQQRVSVARALAKSPRLVLADEPTGNLDPASAKGVLGLIREVCGEAGAALMLVSHDKAVIRGFKRKLRLKAPHE
jgi:ABC-type lipoprotein export system ATPase subunit